MELNNQNFKKFRNDFNKVLADFGKEHGLELSISNISFTDNSFSTKLSGYNVENGKSSDQIEFEKVAFRYGLTEKHYGVTFNCEHGEFKLVGLKPRSKSFPVIVEKNGKKYKMPITVLDSIKWRTEG